MVSEFVLGQTQTTPQDHFLQASKTYTKSSIVNFNQTFGKISAQPLTTLCIQFSDRKNNDKNNTLPLGKQICFTIVWGCTEILPDIHLEIAPSKPIQKNVIGTLSNS